MSHPSTQLPPGDTAPGYPPLLDDEFDDGFAGILDELSRRLSRSDPDRRADD